MSRCFPFPPPGYEPRPRNEHKDLLKKEKRKEKRHRKEKDRGKGERREKDRYHRKGKHNKRHKREKHEERRKNRNKGGDKNQTLEHETRKGYELGNRKPEERGWNEAVKDIIPRDELVTQISSQGHANHRCNNTRELLPWSTDSIGATCSKEKEWNSLSRMVKKSAQATEDNHGMVQKRGNIAHANKKEMGKGIDSKARIKNWKSIQVGSAEVHSSTRHCCNRAELPQHNSDTQRSSEDVHTTSTFVSGAGRVANGRITLSPDTLQRAEEIGQYPEISVHFANGKSDRISTKGMMGKENKRATNFRGKMDQQLVRNKDGAVEGKAKTKELKTNYCKGVKGNDRDRDAKKRKTEYKSKEKEMKKIGTVNEQKHEDIGALGASKDKVDNLMLLGCLNEQKFTSDDIKKRKGFDVNSSPHEHSMRTTKLPRMSPANLTCADEEISKHCQGIIPYSYTELVGANTCGIDQHTPQDSYYSGITGSHYSEEHIASVSSSGYDSNKGYLKPPHPDTKYLSQVNSIPSTQDLSEYIDQDWLFSEDRVEWKTAKFEAAESHQVVWSDAQTIDTADVVALPYVIPL